MFKLRKSLDNCQTPEYLMGEKKYRDYLNKYRKKLDQSLLNYFEWDLFHDGTVPELCISPKTIRMKITSPNFLDPRDRYVNVNFSVSFCGIQKLILKETESSCGDSFIFLFSEIGTLRTPGQGSSIILNFLEFRCGFWFDHLEANPDEPLAFRRLLASGQLRAEGQNFLC